MSVSISSLSDDVPSPPKRPKLMRVDEPAMPKEIFQAMFVEGWDDECLSKADTKTGVMKDFWSTNCPKCKRELLSSKKTSYTNPVDHVKRCMGIEAVTRAVQEHRKAAAASKDGKVAPQVQSSILNSMCMANEQDMLLHRMTLLVTVFNLAIDLFKNPEFLMAIVMDSVGIDLFVDFLIWLVFVVEEKVAAEMKGKKGMIYHDGWSKFGVHYVCLFASYMVELSEKGKFESVMTLITVSTLPYDEDDNSTAVAFNAEAHANFLPPRSRTLALTSLVTLQPANAVSSIIKICFNHLPRCNNPLTHQLCPFTCS